MEEPEWERSVFYEGVQVSFNRPVPITLHSFVRSCDPNAEKQGQKMNASMKE